MDDGIVADKDITLVNSVIEELKQHRSLEVMELVYFYYFPTYFYEKISIVRVILVNLQEYSN